MEHFSTAMEGCDLSYKSNYDFRNDLLKMMRGDLSAEDSLKLKSVKIRNYKPIVTLAF